MKHSWIAFALFALYVLAPPASSGAETAPADPEPVRPADIDASPRDRMITLEEAIERALRLSLVLAAGGSAVAAAEARIGQAGLFPNPELELGAENFGGSDDLSGLGSAETTAVIRQSVPLGGRRGRERDVARSEHAIAGRDLDAVRLDLVSRVASAFFTVLAAQQRVAAAEESLRLAERFADAVRGRVEAGKVSPVEATRAGIEAAQARARLARTVRDLEAERVLLAAAWGSISPSFGRVAGSLPTPASVPDRDHLLFLLRQSPELRRLDDGVLRQEHRLAYERAIRVPDLMLLAGPRRFEETGQSAWVGGLALSLPIFDRNQGAVAASEFELEQVRREAEAVRVEREAALAAELERLGAVAEESAALELEVVPAAAEAFAAVEIGYNEGKFGLLDVLDAQRALFEARSLLLDSREEYALVRTRLERMIGGALESRITAVASGAHPSYGEKP